MIFWRTLTKLFWISRPVSWPNTAYPFAAGYLMSGGQVDAVFVVGTLFFLIPYNLLMYGINDVFDYESDILNPRKGGIEGMREQRAFHPTIMTASIVLSIPFVVFLLSQGTPISKLVLLGSVFFVLAYSIKYLRFKERPVLDSITSSIHFVSPLVYALTLSGFDTVAWPFVIAFFLWGMASHAFGAVQDIIPDRAGGIASIATILGAASTVRLSATFYLVASLIVIVQGFPALLVGLTGLTYLMNIARYLAISDQASSTTNAAWRRFLMLNYLSGFVLTMVLISIGFSS